MYIGELFFFRQPEPPLKKKKANLKKQNLYILLFESVFVHRFLPQLELTYLYTYMHIE